MDKSNLPSEFLACLMLVALLFFIIFLVRIPIIIAKRRGLRGTDLGIIRLLSWLGILLGVTWIVALVFSCAWLPKDKSKKADAMPLLTDKKLSSVDALVKLGNLKEKGLITEEEFNREKAKLLGSL